jgi:GDP/UDP-N,N'-diacetylbacillosamine 2-epimerase (hydrolysing)
MKKYQKKICIITSGRADYGLLRNLINRLYMSKRLKYHLSITGTHLSLKHGYTLREILKDKTKVNSKVNILNYDDSDLGVSKSFSQGVVKFSKLFKKYKPNIIIILGDKFEVFSAATAATLNKIPIAHIHGGEETIGAIDNVIRHSITKMSHVHFTSTDKYKKRVIQMGENSKFIHHVGALGLEDIHYFKFKSKEYFKKKYKLDFEKKTILVCFHPVTLETDTSKLYIIKILSALRIFKNINIIFTAPNADQGYKHIDKEISYFVKKKKNCYYIKSFGRDDYLSCLKLSSVVLGNSSSGIIEAPSLKTVTINLGNRQKGRTKSKSVIDCEINTKKIKNKLKKYLNYKVENSKKYFYNPYFKKNSSKIILDKLENLNYKDLTKKSFFDCI